MSNICVVTDSGSTFSNSRFVDQYPVTVVPYKLDIGGKFYREGIDLTADELMHLIKGNTKPPKLVAPSVQEYIDTYKKILRGYEKIVSIHTSREITESWRNAREASQQVGENRVGVVDSQSICVGQGMLVRVACDAVAVKTDFDDIVNSVRSASERLYAAYYVDTMDFLQHNNILSEARTILGTMLNIKPIISIEEGKPIITEKVRSRNQAIDRLVEFLIEFEEIDDAAIVQNRESITEQTRQLQDRLASEFPGKHFGYTMYGMALGTLFGGNAVGVVVLESEYEGFDDDF